MVKGSKIYRTIPYIAILFFVLVCLEPGVTPVDTRNIDEKNSEPGVIYQDDINTSKPNRIAVIDVADWGVIKFELYDNMTPITTANFVKLAEAKFYDGIKFHRCIDDFVAQTGDPNTRDNNPYNDGSGGSDETIPLEIHPNATHVDGAVGMARSSEPDSASSQFYICDGPQHGLDDIPRMEESGEHGYAVFGVVIEGLEVAKAIAACETYGYMRPALKDHPVDDIIMVSVTIEEGEFPFPVEADGELEENGASIVSEGGGSAFGVVTVFGIILVVGIILWAVVFRKGK